ncbi:hypothetical protein BKA70DRAFT_1444700 [Coprinopsis sp. MPI-PUGE-AT-0042]|nr:hypothetical protein BKA70DRAFT_1444700 [Coprinopsis sp. MPI-PUGE-AT-0042]
MDDKANKSTQTSDGTRSPAPSEAEDVEIDIDIQNFDTLPGLPVPAQNPASNVNELNEVNVAAWEREGPANTRLRGLFTWVRYAREYEEENGRYRLPMNATAWDYVRSQDLTPRAADEEPEEPDEYEEHDEYEEYEEYEEHEESDEDPEMADEDTAPLHPTKYRSERGFSIPSRHSGASMSELRLSSGPSFGRDRFGDEAIRIPSDSDGTPSEPPLLPSLLDLIRIEREFSERAGVEMAAGNFDPQVNPAPDQHHVCVLFRCVGIWCWNTRGLCPLNAILPHLHDVQPFDWVHDASAYLHNANDTELSHQIQVAEYGYELGLNDPLLTPAVASGSVSQAPSSGSALPPPPSGSVPQAQTFGSAPPPPPPGSVPRARPFGSAPPPPPPGSVPRARPFSSAPPPPSGSVSRARPSGTVSQAPSSGSAPPPSPPSGSAPPARSLCTVPRAQPSGSAPPARLFGSAPQASPSGSASPEPPVSSVSQALDNPTPSHSVLPGPPNASVPDDDDDIYKSE